MEIERQFLVAEKPDCHKAIACTDMEQGYLSFDPELRIRRSGERFSFTFKSGAGLVRREEEFAISAADYEKLLPGICGALLRKKRYCLPLSEHLIAEYDEYENEFAGLAFVEVEFPDVKAAESFTPPAWFGREITEDPRFSAALLAKDGREILTIVGLAL